MISGERIERFWVWCGFRFRLSGSENPHYWQQPNGDSTPRLPKLTLGNIFKWGIPKTVRLALAQLDKVLGVLK